MFQYKRGEVVKYDIFCAKNSGGVDLRIGGSIKVLSSPNKTAIARHSSHSSTRYRKSTVYHHLFDCLFHVWLDGLLATLLHAG